VQPSKNYFFQAKIYTKKALWVTQGFLIQEQLSVAAKMPDFGIAKKRDTV